MATPRLLFLYPFLLNPAKTGSRNTIADKARGITPSGQQRRPASTSVESRSVQSQPIPPPGSFLSSTIPKPTRSRSPPPNAGFKTSSKRRRPEIVNQRYGTANEPPPHLIPMDRRLPSKEAIPTQLKLPEPTAAPRGNPKEAESKKQAVSSGSISAAPPSEPKDTSPSVKDTAKSDIGPLKPTPKETAVQQNNTSLSTILGMETDTHSEKPPHLTPPPYVHHFDTFTVVGELEKGGFHEDQAVTIMKLMRIVLAENIELARDGILSKADAEMARISAYLFRAASSELRHEIRNNRQGITERMRGERAQLQHEVDILAQKLSQDTGSLKDDIKGMFDDRKLAVRVERRDIENGIQELNYRITTRLQSEMRSEVEGLRWALVRRTALAIGTIVFMAFIGIRLSQMRKAREEKAEAQRKRDEEAARAAGFIPVDPGGAVKSSMVSTGVQTGDDMNPELVSLG